MQSTTIGYVFRRCYIYIKDLFPYFYNVSFTQEDVFYGGLKISTTAKTDYKEHNHSYAQNGRGGCIPELLKQQNTVIYLKISSFSDFTERCHVFIYTTVQLTIYKLSHSQFVLQYYTILNKLIIKVNNNVFGRREAPTSSEIFSTNKK